MKRTLTTALLLALLTAGPILSQPVKTFAQVNINVKGGNGGDFEQDGGDGTGGGFTSLHSGGGGGASVTAQGTVTTSGRVSITDGGYGDGTGGSGGGAFFGFTAGELYAGGGITIFGGDGGDYGGGAGLVLAHAGGNLVNLGEETRIWSCSRSVRS